MRPHKHRNKCIYEVKNYLNGFKCIEMKCSYLAYRSETYTIVRKSSQKVFVAFGRNDVTPMLATRSANVDTAV
jgi:hypothetical protein